MLRKWILLFLFSFASLFSSLCLAQLENERILKFSVTILVNPDASIDVTEAISVYANQQKIIHGIRRQLPTYFKDSYGRSMHTDYQILKILVNDRPSPYHTTYENNYLNIYIGDKNIVLEPGVYRYSIRYLVNNAVNFLQDADELYWNITGNQWDFTIERAQAYIQLPNDANITKYSGYTGPLGSINHDVTINQTSNNQIGFITNDALPPGSGLTVAVAWQKGIVNQPTFWQLLKFQFRTNRGQIIVLEICLLVLAYYLFAWYLVGRDPERGVIFPLFEPPNNLAPADMRYILHKGPDVKDFTAAIVSMATKGYLRINQIAASFSLTKLTKNEQALSDSEKTIPSHLFSNMDTIDLTPDNSAHILGARQGLERYLKAKYQDRYFITNSKYLWPGILLTILAFITAFIAAHGNPNAVFGIIWLSGWSIGCFALCYSAFIQIQKMGDFPTFGNVLGAIHSLIFALLFLGIEVLVFFSLNQPPLFFIIPLIFITVLLNVAFYYLLRCPTPEGRKVMDQIEGFKMYLGTTEKYRLDALNPPEKTPELFEKYLPYAIALNVAEQWSNQFTKVLEASGTTETPYQPSWYAGPAFTAATLSTFPTLLSDSLNNSLASVSSSSSASGGGGSSGGGGGGGGGGGW